MPTSQERRRPWGLPLELLEDGGAVRDPVHGLTHVSRLERGLLNSPSMQRLRRIRQLGNAVLVYPGATHTRLAHSLGTLATAQQLLDKVFRPRPRRVLFPDLLAEWDGLGNDIARHYAAEASVVARLGALLHDMCHVPFGHVLEDVYGLLERHDAGASRFDTVWAGLVDHLDRQVEEGVLTAEQRSAVGSLADGDLRENLVPLIVSQHGPARPQRYPWVTALVGDTVCADLLDYVQRDYRATGLPFAIDDHLVGALVVTGSQATHPLRTAIRTTREGRGRGEVVRSLVALLRARHHLWGSVYLHHTVIAANGMVAKAVEGWLTHERGQQGVQAGTSAVERALLDMGDDELLGHLARLELDQLDRCGSPEERRRVQAVATLANHVRARRLFKVALTCADRQVSGPLRHRLEVSERRAALEDEIARLAGVDPYHVCLWCPPTEMWGKRLREVLVVEDDHVRPILESTWAETVAQVAEDHRRLWAAHLLVHPAVDSAARDRLRAELVRLTQAHWSRVS